MIYAITKYPIHIQQIYNWYHDGSYFGTHENFDDVDRIN